MMSEKSGKPPITGAGVGLGISALFRHRINSTYKPVTNLKSRAKDMLKQVNETHRPIIITQNGEPKAVLQDTESYENMRETIGILKLLSIRDEGIRGGHSKLQNAVFSDLEELADP